MTGPLVSVDWLAGRLELEGLVIADVRWYLGEPAQGLAAYLEAHVPGAVYVDLEQDLSGTTGPGRHPLPSPAAFTRTLGRLGISPTDTVVAYDDRGGAIASRLWWMLGAIGHAGGAHVLDGGLTAWLAAGKPTEAGSIERDASGYPAAADYRGRPTLDGAELARRSSELTVIDARAPERYRGEDEPIDPVAGHIPGAVNAPYEHNLAPDLRFRSPAELRRQYLGVGVEDASRAVAYCGSGVTACHDLLAMEVAGLGQGILYPGSWSDWGGSGRRVAVGDGDSAE